MRDRPSGQRSSTTLSCNPQSPLCRRGEKLAHANTFKALAEEWLTLESKTLSTITIRAKRARLETWAYRSIGNMPIADIEPSELLAMLKRVEATERHETAHRVRQAISGVFRYAVLTHRAKRDSTADLRGALVPIVEAHHAGLTDPQAVGAPAAVTRAAGAAR